MVSSPATTVAKYLASLPPDRAAEIARVRSVVNAKLPQVGETIARVTRERYITSYEAKKKPKATRRASRSS